MGAGEDVDAVDLVEAEAAQGSTEMGGRDRGRAGRAEALRGERDAAKDRASARDILSWI